MTFADLALGASDFLDANTLLYHFTAEAQFGAACTDLVERVERQDLAGFTATHVVSEVAHRMMTIEVSLRFGRPFAGIVGWMKQNPTEVQQLIQFRQAIAELLPPANWNWQKGSDSSRNMHILTIGRSHLAEGGRRSNRMQ